MKLLQADKDCKVYTTSNAFIVVSEDPNFTEEQGRVRVIDRALLGLSNGEITCDEVSALLKEVDNKEFFLVCPKNVHHMTSIIKHVINDESIS